MTPREGVETGDEGKEFAQIVVPEHSAHLYLPEWNQVCTDNGGMTTLRKCIKTVKEGDN